MIRNFTYLTVLLFTVGSFLHCSSGDHNPIRDASEIENLKEYPNDLFSFQRSYPYDRFDIKAYEAGLKSALYAKNQRNTSPGFDAAWTNEGPGNVGARVNTIEVHPTDEDIVYLGFSSGGVFKTTDGGSNWEALFDNQPFLAIGDITMDPNDSETIYVGTGDPNITGYPSIGNGVYKSTNGGSSWTHMGLTDQRIVSKIIIDPTNSDIIYVSCMGLPFERNNQRGLYKSTDGGLNWEQVLFVSNQSGIIDMVMNPDNPQIIYAASWDRIRNNEESVVYGPNAKIHKSIDGGDTWTVLTNGLPSGEQGRIGLAMAGTDSDILVCVYVGTDQRLLGIYRTEDAGDNWSAIPISDQNGLGIFVLSGFGWYFGQIRIHPEHDDWIYLLGVSAWRTTNNGQQWTTATNGSSTTPHVDYHDLVFNFQNDIIVGNDGGAYKKESNSVNFVDFENIPATEFYRVAYDPHRPDNYYGGTQDNGSLYGNGDAPNNWNRALGGDGFQMRFHPTDSEIIFAETQNGNIFKSTTGLTGFISSTSGINPNDRKHWDMQYIISPHDPNRMYTGTYRVYKSETSGPLSWENISPDLTDGVIFGNGFHTITTLDESPLVEDLLYVGTTDANIWRTEDGGTTWDSLHADLPNRYITSVKASPDFEDHVYVCISGYRYNENTPRVYKSTDRGDNWTSIAGDLPDLGVNDIIILPGQEDQILFVATDGGVYASTNGGASWESLGVDYPMVTTYDMAWNEAKNELVAGTFGRSIYSYPIDSLLDNLDASLTVSGQVLTENGVGIDSVEIVLNGTGFGNMTNVDGAYDINNLVLGTECEIAPEKNINIRNGVSTFDLLKMQAHILLVDTLDSPYKILAGDVNNSNSLSTFDLVIARKVLLFIQDTFVNTDSWRFIPADYSFSNPANPFLEDYPELTNCSTIQNGGSADFIGFKVGDANGNANPSMLTGGEEAEQREDEILSFFMKEQSLEKGKQYQIPFYAKDFNQITGFQFGLKCSDHINIENLSAESLTDFDVTNYFYDEKSKELRISWSNPYAINVKENEPVFYLMVNALEGNLLSNVVKLESETLRPEAYNLAEQIFEPKLSFEKLSEAVENDTRVIPNPFTERTDLLIEVELSGNAELSIYDFNGILVYSKSEYLTSGSNSISINADDLKNKGLYVYRLMTNGQHYSGKLFLK